MIFFNLNDNSQKFLHQKTKKHKAMFQFLFIFFIICTSVVQGINDGNDYTMVIIPSHDAPIDRVMYDIQIKQVSSLAKYGFFLIDGCHELGPMFLPNEDYPRLIPFVRYKFKQVGCPVGQFVDIDDVVSVSVRKAVFDYGKTKCRIFSFLFKFTNNTVSFYSIVHLDKPSEPFSSYVHPNSLKVLKKFDNL